MQPRDSKSDEEGIAHVLVLMIVLVGRCGPSTTELIIDYEKSIMLTFDGHLAWMEQLVAKCSNVRKEKKASKVFTKE
jgi:hypothetical protein